ncbi:MAG: HdeD family acid-resistance protein [Hyphomicrobiales bacterium]|nr:HdeD family acid-resistance protein [Hyphomicrobiales bacterium]
MTTPLSPSAGLHNLGDAIRQLRARWGWFVAYGALCAIMGLITLLYLVVQGTIASVFMIGLAMILAGGSEIVIGFRAKSWGWLMLWVLAGLLYIVAGALALAQPLLAAAGFTLFLGAAMLATGVMRVVAAFRMEPGSKAMLALSGLITIALGGLILSGWPATSLFVLGTFLGIDLLFYGLTWIGFGLRLKSHNHHPVDHGQHEPEHLEPDH